MTPDLAHFETITGMHWARSLPAARCYRHSRRQAVDQVIAQALCRMSRERARDLLAAPSVPERVSVERARA